MLSGAEKNWPRFCCAIVRGADGRYLLEQRPAQSQRAAGLMTCFGGTREEGEEPTACLRRELREELGLSEMDVEMLGFQRAVTLHRRGELVAWFYSASVALPRDVRLVTEPGHEAVWLSEDEVRAEERLSSWHRAALSAFIKGEAEARLE